MLKPAVRNIKLPNPAKPNPVRLKTKPDVAWPILSLSKLRAWFVAWLNVLLKNLAILRSFLRRSGFGAETKINGEGTAAALSRYV